MASASPSSRRPVPPSPAPSPLGARYDYGGSSTSRTLPAASSGSDKYARQGWKSVLERLGGRLRAAGHPAVPVKNTDTSLEEQASDLAYLEMLLASRETHTLLDMHDQLSSAMEAGMSPASTNSSGLSRDVARGLNSLPDKYRHEGQALQSWLNEPEVQALFVAYDKVGKTISSSESQARVTKKSDMSPDGRAAVCLQFSRAGEPLGCTIRSERGPDGQPRIVIARLMANTLSERCGLIYPNDELVKVNDASVAGMTTQEVVKLMKGSGNKLSLTIVPGARNSPAPEPRTLSAQRNSTSRLPSTSSPVPFADNDDECHVRALFSYDPASDAWAPCPEGGLAFSVGDVLKIVRKDGDWWQAEHVRGPGDLGLIPSELVEERRPNAVFALDGGSGERKGSKRRLTRTRSRHGRERTDSDSSRRIPPYEPVARIEPLLAQPRPVALLGPPGVGRASIMQRLLTLYPDLFTLCIPHTTRPPKPGEEQGVTCHFVTQKQMEKDIAAGMFVQHGMHDGHYYATSYAELDRVSRDGRVCLIDASPSAIENLRSPKVQAALVLVQPPNLVQLRQSRSGQLTREECVEILAASERYERLYRPYCDLLVTNNDLTTAVGDLVSFVQKLRHEPQWVPEAWAKQQKARGSSQQGDSVKFVV